jgi:hypothetical protein
MPREGHPIFKSLRGPCEREKDVDFSVLMALNVGLASLLVDDPKRLLLVLGHGWT